MGLTECRPALECGMTSSPHALLTHARENAYALAAFNAVNLETASAIVRAAELERAPVILQVSENAAHYAGLKPLYALARALKDEATVPIILHFDHAASPQSARRALELGFDSVMLEGADQPPEENVRQLKELVGAARAQGAVVEGEFEVVKKGEREGERLSLGLIQRYADEAGCDTVAVDLGSEHKQTRKEASLDLARLREIARLVPQPLVLHGGSGVAEEDLRRAVTLGVSKVNVATELMLAFTEGVRAGLEPGSYDPRSYLGEGRAAMTTKARYLIRLLGGANTADGTA